MKEKKEYIGRALKAIRTEKGISIEKASKDTRITQVYLKAIEEEQFNKLPGDVVLKGFIRVYSDYLGADPKPFISELNKRLKKDAPPPITEPGPGWKPDLGPAVKIAAAVAAAALALALLAALVWTGVSCAGRKDVGIQPQVTIPSQLPQDSFTIKVEILEKTWLSVRADGREVFSGVLLPGSGESWSAKKSVAVRMGNAAGVRITSGSETLFSPGNRGEVVTKEYFR